MEKVKTFLSHRAMMRLKQEREQTIPKYRDANVKNLVEYLDTIDWNFFITGTTGYELTLKSARRLAERYHSNLPPKSLFFWVGESFELKDGYHIHGLIKIPDVPAGKVSPILFNRMVDKWQIATGNKVVENDHGALKWEIWNRIDLQPYMKHVGAHGYCAKYINKSKGDYDLLT